MDTMLVNHSKNSRNYSIDEAFRTETLRRISGLRATTCTPERITDSMETPGPNDDASNPNFKLVGSCDGQTLHTQTTNAF